MARIVTGAGLYRLIDVSLRPVIRAIGLSLGPDGRTVLYERAGSLDVGRAITGFTIAREMPIPSGPLGVALRILKETLFTADRDFGDGTARLALIAGECFSAGAREVIGGTPLRSLCEMIAVLNDEIGNWLDDERVSQVDLKHIAHSVGVTSILAEKLTALVEELGSAATFDVKENNGQGMEVTKSKGFVFDAKPLGNEALIELSSANVLVVDEIINDFGTLASVLEGFAGKRKTLVIAARDITGSALATLRQNQRADVVTVVGLQPSDSGQWAADCLEDLAVATGATLIAERFGTKLERLRPTMLGQAAGFGFSDGKATFIEPKGRAEDVAFRRKLLAAEADKARYLSYDRELFERRRGRLGGQWCELRIAGGTSHETAALITGTRAAIRAMQSAMRDGAVSGGGALFKTLATRLINEKRGATEAGAAQAVARGLLAIPYHLAVNAGSTTDSTPLDNLPLQDPLHLTKIVINQGLTLATSLLRTGAVIAR